MLNMPYKYYTTTPDKPFVFPQDEHSYSRVTFVDEDARRWSDLSKSTWQVRSALRITQEFPVDQTARPLGLHLCHCQSKEAYLTLMTYFPPTTKEKRAH